MVIKNIEQFTISDCCAQLGLDSRHPEEGLKRIQPLGSQREIVARLLGLLEYVRRTLSIESVDSYLVNIEEMDFIDIGLSSKWAKYNCGAHSELEYGDCFSWGEILTKEKYGRKYYTLSKKNRWKTDEYYDIGNEISATSYDPVVWRYGLDCKMPSMLDFSELLFKCKWEFQYGYKMKPFYKIIGPNGNSIFLPFAPLNNQNISDFEGGGPFIGVVQFRLRVTHWRMDCGYLILVHLIFVHITKGNLRLVKVCVIWEDISVLSCEME